MGNPRDTTTCAVCGARLLRRWNARGTDFVWLDESGRNRAGQGGPDGIEEIEDYLDWLREHDIGTYSLFLARVDLGAGILPWQHWHLPTPVAASIEERQNLPWCCGEPARRIRDRWICRENANHHPESQEDLVSRTGACQTRRLR